MQKRSQPRVLRPNRIRPGPQLLSRFKPTRHKGTTAQSRKTLWWMARAVARGHYLDETPRGFSRTVSFCGLSGFAGALQFRQSGEARIFGAFSMSEVGSALLVFALLLMATGVGVWVRPLLPEEHKAHETV